MTKHALLSASSSARWIACPPSARLCVAAGDTSSPYAQQGTDAHALAEYKVLRALGREATDPTEALDFFDREMAECTDDYAAFVMEQYEAAKQYCRDPLILTEQRLDYSRWVPKGFGTGDCSILSDRILKIIDFKYGVGVLVEADHNPQMMCYALGVLDLYDGIYDIETIRMTIYQPRRSNLSTFELSKEELLAWAEETLRPAASLAYEEKGEFHAGDHCRFCSVKAVCRKRAEHSLELEDFVKKNPAELTDAEIEAILPRIDELTAWADDLKAYALEQALAGTDYPGFKVVEGRSVRKYTNRNAVAEVLEKAGYNPYVKKLMGVTEMTSLLGKKRFNELLGDYVIKPPGKPALVTETDRRPALSTAKEDFKENR